MPTAKEQGIDLVIDKFRGIAAPKGQPPEIIAAWEAGVQAVLADPDFKKWYTDASLVPNYMDHDAYGAFIEDFAAQQSEFFKTYNITKK